MRGGVDSEDSSNEELSGEESSDEEGSDEDHSDGSSDSSDEQEDLGEIAKGIGCKVANFSAPSSTASNLGSSPSKSEHDKAAFKQIIDAPIAIDEVGVLRLQQKIQELQTRLDDSGGVTITQMKYKILESETREKRAVENAKKEMLKVKQEADQAVKVHTANVQKKWTIRKKEVDQAHQSALETTCQKNEAKMGKMQAQHKDKMDAKDAAHKTALAIKQESYDEKIEAMKNKHAEQEQKAKDKFERLKEDHKGKTAKLKGEHKTALSNRSPALKRKIEEQTAKLAEHKLKIQKLQQDSVNLQKIGNLYADKCTEYIALTDSLDAANTVIKNLRAKTKNVDKIRDHEGQLYAILKRNSDQNQVRLNDTQRACANVKASNLLKDGSIRILKAEVDDLEKEIGGLKEQLRLLAVKGTTMQAVMIRKVGPEGMMNQMAILKRELRKKTGEAQERDKRIAELVAELEEKDEVAAADEAGAVSAEAKQGAKTVAGGEAADVVMTGTENPTATKIKGDKSAAGYEAIAPATGQGKNTDPTIENKTATPLAATNAGVKAATDNEVAAPQAPTRTKTTAAARNNAITTTTTTDSDDIDMLQAEADQFCAEMTVRDQPSA